MATISLQDAVTLTEIQSSLINSNNSALRSALNGGLDETNFINGTLYSPSKLKQEAASVGDTLVWNGSIWQPGPPTGATLATVVYDPAADATVTLAPTTTFIDVDATNYTITITVPSTISRVLITFSLFAKYNSGNTTFTCNLRELVAGPATIDVTGSDRLFYQAIGGNYQALTWQSTVTGVTVGNHTYKLGIKAAAAANISFQAGPTNGPLIIQASTY